MAISQASTIATTLSKQLRPDLFSITKLFNISFVVLHFIHRLVERSFSVEAFEFPVWPFNTPELAEVYSFSLPVYFLCSCWKFCSHVIGFHFNLSTHLIFLDWELIRHDSFHPLRLQYVVSHHVHKHPVVDTGSSKPNIPDACLPFRLICILS